MEMIHFFLYNHCEAKDVTSRVDSAFKTLGNLQLQTLYF